MDEGRRHGRGVQPADCQPRHARGAAAHGGRMPQRPHRRIHAVDAGALRGDTRDRERRARAADQARPRAQVRREGGREVQGVAALTPP